MSQAAHFEADDNPVEIAKEWLQEARRTEPNDPDAIALATVDAQGMPNVRMVLLREIEPDSFLFYTNYTSAKATEIEASSKAAFVLHWKSLRRQVRVRGDIARAEAEKADAYFQSRSPASRIGAWASRQSAPLDNRETLISRCDHIRAKIGSDPERPSFWGGYRIVPLEIELWIDGEARLHDRFQWRRETIQKPWQFTRLYP